MMEKPSKKDKKSKGKRSKNGGSNQKSGNTIGGMFKNAFTKGSPTSTVVSADGIDSAISKTSPQPWRSNSDGRGGLRAARRNAGGFVKDWQAKPKVISKMGAVDQATLIRDCAACSTALRDVWKRLERSEDVEEFVALHDLIEHSLGMVSKLQHPENEEEFLRELMTFRAVLTEWKTEVLRLADVEKLRYCLASPHRRRKIARNNSRVYKELKIVLMLAGLSDKLDSAPAQLQRTESVSVISSTEGFEFWMKSFKKGDLVMVAWQRFSKAYRKYIGKSFSPADEMLLKLVLDNGNTGYVTPRRFSDLLKAFAPMSQSLEKVKAVFEQKWFQGFLSVEEVVHLLSDQAKGTFLVRFSKSRTDSFALEYVESKGKIRTVKILNCQPQGVEVEQDNDMSKRFKSLTELIQHYPFLKRPFFSDILQQHWFKGDMGKEEAEELLEPTPPGTFMIRLSEFGTNHFLVCSYVNRQRRIKHVLLQKVRSGYVQKRIDETAKKSDIIYPTIGDFIKHHHQQLRYNYDPEGVPSLPVVPFQSGTKVEIAAPTDKGGGDKSTFGDTVCAHSVATYPCNSLGYQVMCDYYRLTITGNRTIFALADGCNWGLRPREAAIRASKAFVNFLAERQDSINHTLDAKHFMLRALSKAHEKIVEGQETIWDAGTTTLLGGIIMQLQLPGNTTSRWAFVAVSVGDCKAFLWDKQTKDIIDITRDNRRNQDARDCGGRLGPYVGNGQPDLRNLACWFYPLNEGDIVLIVSDGVWDNVDPVHLGRDPKDIGLDIESWDDATAKQIREVKVRWMQEQMTKLAKTAKEPTPDGLASVLLEHAKNTTKNTRVYMEQNPQAAEPSDYKAYPGKMDHSTVVAVQIGHNGGVEPVQKSMSAVSSNTKKIQKQFHQLDVDSFYDAIPKRMLYMFNPDSFRSVSGPGMREVETAIPGWVSGFSKSLFPHTLNDQDMMDDAVFLPHGGPINEAYAMEFGNGRSVSCMSAALRYGTSSQSAANRASNTFMDYATLEQKSIRTSHDAIKILLKGVESAHKTITRTDRYIPQPCQLMGSMLLRQDVAEPALVDDQEWMWISVNLGQSKAFLWRHATRKVEEMTYCKRFKQSTAQIGPLLDLEDIQIYHVFCATNDIIITLTSNTSANFDPEFNGKSPSSVGLKGYNTWADMPFDQAYAAKSKWRCEELEKVFKRKLQPSQITNAIIQKCHALTKKSRNLMKDNENSMPPADYSKYPGVLCHASCLTFKVGTMQVPKPQRASNREDLLSTRFEKMPSATPVRFGAKLTETL